MPEAGVMWPQVRNTGLLDLNQMIHYQLYKFDSNWFLYSKQILKNPSGYVSLTFLLEPSFSKLSCSKFDINNYS